MVSKLQKNSWKVFLDAKNTDYDTYVERLITDNLGNISLSSAKEVSKTTEKKKGSFFKRFFGIE